MPKLFSIRIGDQFASSEFPNAMKSDLMQSRKFSTVPDAILFAIDRRMGFLFVDRKQNVITLGFVVVSISESMAESMEIDARDRFAAMTPLERINSYRFKPR